MTPSEKEKIIEEGFDAIRRVYNLRDDLLSDAGKLEAARESNRKLSDRVVNLEATIRTLNSAIDKKDAEIRNLKAAIGQMIADNRKKKEEVKCLKEELEAEKYGSVNRANLKDNFHELRKKLTDMYMTGTLRGFSTSDFTEFAKWFKDTFGDFGIYDEEE